MNAEPAKKQDSHVPCLESESSPTAYPLYVSVDLGREFLHPIFTGFYGETVWDGGGNVRGCKSAVITCLLIDQSGNVLSRGMAICSERDQFNRERGKHIAMGRAMMAISLEEKDQRRSLGSTIRRRKVRTALITVGFLRPNGKPVCLKKSMPTPSLFHPKESRAILAWRKAHGLMLTPDVNAVQDAQAK